MNVLTYERTNVLTYERIDVWTSERMDVQTYEQMTEWTSEQMDVKPYGWMKESITIWMCYWFAIHSDDGLFDLPSDRLYPHILYNQNGSSYRDIDEDMKKEFVIHLD